MKTPTFAALLTLTITLSIICSATAKTLTPILETQTATETRFISPEVFEQEQFGRAVAIDGNTAVLGAPNFAFTQNDGFGAAYVYVKTETGWQFQQKLTPFDAAPQKFFGMSVAVSGDTIVVGAHGDTNAGPVSGAAYVFERIGGTWLHKQKLTGSENSMGDVFGLSVAIDGNTIVCGAWGNVQVFNTFGVGTAYVFNLIGNQWLETQKLSASDAAENKAFGVTCAIDGDTIIVGATGDSEFKPFAGAVYVFTFDGSAWHEQAKLHAQSPDPQVIFGYRLDVSGDTIVVASEGRAEPPLRFGAAYIFRRTPSGWHQQKKITTDEVVVDGRPENMGQFGLTVAVSGDRVVVGSPNDPTINYWSGSAFVYRRNGESSWALDQHIFPSDAARDDSFTSAMAMDGDTLLVGSWVKFSPLPFAGAGYIYEF
ncbi:MAG TPA: hypothetical protein VJS17_05360 [Pyrinomonadaceae bacterium]|nr:hypothetical protein [Pyrinomonadaceae bacterium]